MSPSKFQDCDLNPSPLRISKDSHSIHKPSFSSSHHQPITENAGHTPAPKHTNVLKRQPVIIYTHSPKVIHAQAQDFMALVQKLTSRSKPKLIKDERGKNCGLKNDGYEENEASSLTIEKFTMGDQAKQDCSAAASQMCKISNACMSPRQWTAFHSER